MKNAPYISLKNQYFDKDNLIDDKKEDVDDYSKNTSKRDYIIKHMFKIQGLIELYENKEYHDFIVKTGYKINSIKSKRIIKEKMDKLKDMTDSKIKDIIEFAHDEKICIKDDKFNAFIKDNWYLYNRVANVPFKEFKNLYNYLEGYVPLSTQHKIKGTEFDNVLLILENGGWNNYNFMYLLNPGIKPTLTPAKQRSFDRILKRTEKLFYVCCTRAKKELIIYYPDSNPSIISNMETLLGKENVHDLTNL